MKLTDRLFLIGALGWMLSVLIALIDNSQILAWLILGWLWFAWIGWVIPMLIGNLRG